MNALTVSIAAFALFAIVLIASLLPYLSRLTSAFAL